MSHHVAKQNESVYRYRVTYEVLGRLRFLSHKELMRAMIRAFRRARVPLAYSHGYHPHPLFSFGPPRPVGMAGTAEQLDVRCTAAVQPSELQQRVNAQCPPGLALVAVAIISPTAPAIAAQVTSATYTCTWPHDAPSPEAAIEELLAQPEILCSRVRGTGARCIDLRAGIFAVRWEPPVLQMQLAVQPTCYVRPYDVLAVLTGWPDEIIRRVVITRTGFHYRAGATSEQHGTRNLN
ncbi:MAG: TIGR03936 family radical SAM-associated protein [bacterium]|nr:TIGR03936 family radical SAM-associated protein [bacterium]